MATDAWLESADRAGRRPRPVGIERLADSHHLAGAGATYGADDAESAAAERVVRRMLNRHGCQAPRRLAEAERAGVIGKRLIRDIRAHPGVYCGDPRHDDDAALLAEALEWLGLRPTPPPARRSDAITVRAKRTEARGVCRECGRRQGVRADGTIRAHGGCPGERLAPKEGA